MWTYGKNTRMDDASHPVLLCFQPGFSAKLLRVGAHKLILVDSAPQRKKPTGRPRGPDRHFIRDLLRFYDDNGFILRTILACRALPSDQFSKPAATVDCGCCAPRKLPDYAEGPWRFYFTNGSMEIAHYVTSGYPHHMSVELRAELQESTGLVVTQYWVPPVHITNLFDDPMPRNLYIDSALRPRSCPHSIIDSTESMGGVRYMRL